MSHEERTLLTAGSASGSTTLLTSSAEGTNHASAFHMLPGETSDNNNNKSRYPSFLTDSTVSSFDSSSNETNSVDTDSITNSDRDDSEKNMGATTSFKRKQELLLDHQQTPSNYWTEPWMQRVWIVHFVVGFAVLIFSVLDNGGQSKYIPVDPSYSSSVSGIEELSQCQKVFVNIMAGSSHDPHAVVCCMPHGNESMLSSESIFDLCPPSPAKEAALPFLGRLAKFPDAWLIPLFPLLLRIAFRTYQTVLEQGHLVLDTTFGVYSFRRLVFYFLLMQFRGWFLYMGLNAIEDNFLSNDNNESPCWYHDWVQNTESFCYGRKFDFSDHVVLYYAQLLPIALLEYLHSINKPYWPFHCFRRFALPAVLSAGMLYLYFITFVGVYKTAAYFHTPSETLAGYAVSLLAHLPLCALQCANAFPALTFIREYFFGPKSKVLLQ